MPEANTAKQSPLPADTQAALEKIAKTLQTPGTKLGHLGRGFGVVARRMQEYLDAYGSTVRVHTAAGRTREFPITIGASLTLRISDGEGDPTEYTVDLNPTPPAQPEPRKETPLNSFPEETPANHVVATA